MVPTTSRPIQLQFLSVTHPIGIFVKIVFKSTKLKTQPRPDAEDAKMKTEFDDGIKGMYCRFVSKSNTQYIYNTVG